MAMTALAAAINVQPSDGLYSAESERACLGAALLDNSALRGPLAELAVDDFFLVANRKVFALMLESDDEGQPFDPSNIVESLRERRLLDQETGRQPGQDS